MPEHELQVFREVRIQTPVAFIKQGKPTFGELPLSDSIDVTKLLGASTVEFEETDQETDRLSFTLRHGALGFMENTAIGMKVQFIGGYNIDRNDGVLTKKVFFNGFIAQRRPRFPDHGRLELELICEDALFLLTRNKPGAIAYPSKELKEPGPMTKRKFHYKKEMKISEIADGIVKEYGIEVGQIDIDELDDETFTCASPLTQSNKETDFEFLTRILTGRSKDGVGPAKQRDKEQKLTNARARMFMEQDALTNESKFHIIPESKLVGGEHEGKITFHYHSEGGEIVPVDEFDPTNDPLTADPKLIIKNVQIRENPDAGAKGTQHGQDVGPFAKGAHAGTQLTEEIDDPTFLEEYIVNEPQVIADATGPDAILTLDEAAAILGGQRNWDSYKHYFILRETIYHSTSRNIVSQAEEVETPPGAGEEPSEDEKTIGTVGSGGRGSKGTSRSAKRRGKGRIKKYGEELSFTCHGNIFTLCRKTYELFFPVGYYSGFWYCFKVKHKFGPIYTMDMTLGR